jgi:hypothetical protein
MFGGGGAVFAHMPSYTPVTRRAEQSPPRAEPQTPSYQGTQNYPSASPSPAPSYNSAEQFDAASARPFSGSPQDAPQYPNSNGYASQGQGGHAYPSQEGREQQGYAGQGYSQQAHSGASYARPSNQQGYSQQGYSQQGHSQASYPQEGTSETCFDANFEDTSFTEPSLENTIFSEPNFSELGYPQEGFAAQNGADASFPEGSFDGEASFPEDDNAGSGGYQHDESHQDESFNLGMPRAEYGQGYQPLNEQAFNTSMGLNMGQAAPDPHRALQTFDAPYDQPPQIPLGATQAPRGPQNYYQEERPDADFLDDGKTPSAEVVASPGRKLTLKSRSMVMVGSTLLGAVALGGALAFAYKQSGGAMSTSEPPVVQADSRPVKEAPDQSSGKDFPHKNKLIYDRFVSDDQQPEQDHLVPRQEDVAMPAMPGMQASGPAASPAPAGQVTDPNAPPTVATVDDPEGGPRRVKTLVVRADGSVMQPDVTASAAPAAQAPAGAPQGAPSQPQAQTAAVQTGPAPAPSRVAAIPPQPEAKIKPAAPATDAAAAKPANRSQYVVQVGSKQNQTDALATFADMQQKYPTLLANYRPMVQKADLGAKGVWYRLRIGPIADKGAATKLCSQLKSQGLSDCLVMTQ